MTNESKIIICTYRIKKKREITILRDLNFSKTGSAVFDGSDTVVIFSLGLFTC